MTKKILASPEGKDKSGRRRELRHVLAGALKKNGWYGSAYGEDRERALTAKIGQAIGVGTRPMDVENWERNKMLEEVLGAVDKAIAYLK